FSAALALAGGVVLLAWPVSGAVSFSLLLIVFFIIEGVLSIMYALEHRKEPRGRWGWMLMSGIIDFILAVIVWAGLPGTAARALSLLVGIYMLFDGSALIAMALHARSRDTARSSDATRGFSLASLIASGLLFSICILTIAHVFALLAGPVARLFGKPLD